MSRPLEGNSEKASNRAGGESLYRLWELDPAPLLESRLLGLMPLVPLRAGQDLQTLLERSTEVIRAGVQSAQERHEVLALTGLLASLKDVRVVEQFFRSRSIMSLLSATTLLRVLERKFGSLPVDLREAIQTITDPERLEQLLDAAIDAADLDSFRSQAQIPTQN